MLTNQIPGKGICIHIKKYQRNEKFEGTIPHIESGQQTYFKMLIQVRWVKIGS